MTKSILSEQREADEGLCYKLRLASALLYVFNEGEFGRAAFDASARIRALSEALREACHERDGLLAKVEMMAPAWNASSNGAFSAGIAATIRAKGYWVWDNQIHRWRFEPTPPGEMRWD